MNLFLRLGISILLLSASIAGASDFDIHETWQGIESDSGIVGPTYEAIEQELLMLEKQFPQTAERVVYGLSVKGKPLNLLKIARKQIQRRGERYAVLMSGTTHGDEYLGIEDKLPRWFLTVDGRLESITKFLDMGGIIYTIPILNPDGYAARRRTNANGVDLNRDFRVDRAGVKGFTQPETAMLVRFIAEDVKKWGARLSVTVDYHCCIGALLHPWSFITQPMPEADLKAHRFLGGLMQTQFGQNYVVGTTPDILGYEAKGSSKDSYYEQFGARSFTFEGVRVLEKDKFEFHSRWWDSILRAHLRPAQPRS